MTRTELLKIAKPILFNTEMVKAILEGRKTVTRRVIKGQDKKTMYAGSCLLGAGLFDNETKERVIVPPYKVGDVLYVRETWQGWSCAECDWECVPDNGNGCCTMPRYLYRASDEETDKGWKPSIHMPKEAARIFLKVKDVRVERLQDITEEQATKEGCKAGSYEYKGAIFGQEDTEEWTAIEDFINLWNSTIKKSDLELYGWNANPYVWVIEIERIEPEGE